MEFASSAGEDLGTSPYGPVNHRPSRWDQPPEGGGDAGHGVHARHGRHRRLLLVAGPIVKVDGSLDHTGSFPNPLQLNLRTPLNRQGQGPGQSPVVEVGP